jgi:phosphate transport system substrate-binding protein
MNVRTRRQTRWIAAASATGLAAAVFAATFGAPAPVLAAIAPPQEAVKALAKEKEEDAKVDTSLPPYQPVSGVSGNLNSVGSDTLNNLMTLWAEGFKGQYPNVRIQVEGKGSSSAPPALIAGTAQLGPMSRKMKKSEIDDFEGKFGYEPTCVSVAIDALAVYVHKDNPIPKLTLAQVDAIFGKQRKSGFEKNVATWGDLGLTGEWAQLPISLYGRNSTSGTYGFFKEHVLQNGDYKDTVKEQPGSASVILGVTEDRAGIGYSGIGYKTSGVRAVPLAAKADGEAAPIGASTVYGGKYPLTRFLFVYVNKAPNKPLDPLVKEFLTYVLSLQGQQGTLKDGYFPLTSKIASGELKQIQ